MGLLVVQREIAGAEHDTSVVHRALKHENRFLTAVAMGGNASTGRAAHQQKPARGNVFETIFVETGRQRVPGDLGDATRERLGQRGWQRAGHAGGHLAGGRVRGRVEAGEGAGAVERGAGFGAFGEQRAAERLDAREQGAAAATPRDMAKDQQIHPVRQGARGVARQRFDGSMPRGHCRTCQNIGTSATSPRRDRITFRPRRGDDCAKDVMRPVFLVEPFGYPRPFAALLGTGPDMAPDPATLPGHAIGADATGLRLGPARRAGAEAPGWILNPTEAERARIAFWMTAIGAKPLVAKARRADGVGEVVDTFLPPPGVATLDWRREDWTAEWCATLAEAIEEILRHLGLVDPDHVGELLLGVGYRALARARGAADATPSRLRSGLAAAGDVEPLRLDLPYANYFCVEEHHLRHRRFDGAMSAPILRAAFTSGDAVTVLPFDPRTGCILLIEQFRAGPLARRDPRPWCLETVAGRCDPRENPEATARREAREEAGLEIGRVEQVARYYPSPGVMSEYITAFVAEADLSGAGGRHGLASEDEDIRALVVPLDEALAAIASGEINNSPLLITLLWLEKHRARLSAAWG